jgi:hypothetical protein
MIGEHLLDPDDDESSSVSIAETAALWVEENRLSWEKEGKFRFVYFLQAIIWSSD